MRGKLSSRPVGDVLREAEKLVKSGVQELLVISQDTSAYGADLKYAKGQWRDREYETRLLGLCEGLSELGAWVRLHYVYPYPHVDHIMPLIAERKVQIGRDSCRDRVGQNGEFSLVGGSLKNK